MGNLCSKSSTLSGGHTVLGGPGSTANARSDDSEIRRQRIAEAAERRQEADRNRGVVQSNPKSGELSKKLVENSTLKSPPARQRDDQLVWD